MKESETRFFEKGDYYNPIRKSSFYSNKYVEYESSSDKKQTQRIS